MVNKESFIKKQNSMEAKELNPKIKVLENGNILVTLKARGWGKEKWIKAIGNMVTIGDEAIKFLADDSYEQDHTVEVLLIGEQTDYASNPRYHVGVYENNNPVSGVNSGISELKDEAVFILAQAITADDFKKLGLDFIYINVEYRSPFETEREDELDNYQSRVGFRLCVNNKDDSVGIYAYVDRGGDENLNEHDKVAIFNFAKEKDIPVEDSDSVDKIESGEDGY
jgi:hypothetical protein